MFTKGALGYEEISNHMPVVVDGTSFSSYWAALN